MGNKKTVFTKKSLKRKISLSHFGDLLRSEWEQGHIGDEVYEWIQSGRLPIQYLRDQLRWIIERSEDEGYLNLTEF